MNLLKDSSKLSTLPTELILETLSHMKSNKIIEYCTINRRINTICKKNRDIISKYALQNDYGFTKFPSKYNYSSIMSYIHKRPGFDNNKQLINAVIDNRMDVLQFLVTNGANAYNDAVKTAVIYNNYKMFLYFIEQLEFDITNNEFYFNNLCVLAFTNPYIYENSEIVEYIIKHYYKNLTQDFLETLYQILLEENSVPLADYVQLLMNAVDITKVESLSEFLNDYMNIQHTSQSGGGPFDIISDLGSLGSFVGNTVTSMAKQRVEDTYSNASTALNIAKDIAKDKVESAYKNATFVLEHMDCNKPGLVKCLSIAAPSAAPALAACAASGVATMGAGCGPLMTQLGVQGTRCAMQNCKPKLF